MRKGIQFSGIAYILIGFVFISVINSACSPSEAKFFSANHSYIQYTGRVDFSNPELPRFWTPGVYIEAEFEGDSCIVEINDEVLWGNNHNYISTQVDDRSVQRIKLTGEKIVIKVAEGLGDGPHKLTLCKSTESGRGYLEFVGLYAEQLLKPAPKPRRKIEFYGNSITCGTGSDLSEIPCDSAEWYDQHNAFMSYGPVTARSLDAQWMLSSVSGIGLMHSCCDMDIVMPDVYDKVNMRDNKIDWDFSEYQPDVVTVALGQNDGIQDSTEFCLNYVDFINTLRGKYPDSKIVCLTSPMGNEKLTATLKNYLTSVKNTLQELGDDNVYTFFFSRSYNNGCGGHPDLAQHSEIADELLAYLTELMDW
jgi:hypothetical protein